MKFRFLSKLSRLTPAAIAVIGLQLFLSPLAKADVTISAAPALATIRPLGNTGFAFHPNLWSSDCCPSGQPHSETSHLQHQQPKFDSHSLRRLCLRMDRDCNHGTGAVHLLADVNAANRGRR